jgi:hypothetical protein
MPSEESIKKVPRTKHQHWVPQFYLNYFATEGSRHTSRPQVWIFSKDEADGDEKLCSVRNVCGQRYLYSPRQIDGQRTWALENALGTVETLIGKVWPAIAVDFVDLADPSLRKAISLFLATTHHRHPKMLDAVEHTHRQMVDFYEGLPKDHDGIPFVDSVELKGRVVPFDPSGWHEYKREGPDGHHRFFAEFVRNNAGEMAQHLLSKRWSVVFSESDVFVTGDKPVVLSHAERDVFGYGTRGTILQFPLSPRRMLVLDDMHNEPANQYYPLDPVCAGAFNYTTWHGSTRFLITGRGVEEVLSEICAAGDQLDADS